MSSTGRRTVSAGLPGTGLYASESYNPRAKSRTPRASNKFVPQDLHQFDGPPPKPTLFSRKAEKAFYGFIMDIEGTDKKHTPKEIVEKAKALSEAYDALIYPLNLMVFIHILNAEEYDEKIIEMGSHLWSNREAAFSDPIVFKYFRGIRPVVRLTEGVFATETLNQQQFGFIWSEVLQAHDKYVEALGVLHEMEPNQLVAIAIADIELSEKDYPEVLETTADITNEDDATSILLTLRGIAFREQGHLEASLECMKLALAKKGRDPQVLHRAHFERSITYEKMGKIASATKDLEMILVDVPANEEVLSRLNELKG